MYLVVGLVSYTQTFMCGGDGNMRRNVAEVDMERARKLLCICVENVFEYSAFLRIPPI